MIVGTAGHIDHGKTALVRALTGVDTDRLPEEKRRGITIELGFAPLDLAGVGRAGIVDVPGHEAFIRTMVAGASGIDLGLVVVAADEGVMPQTREHVTILSLLGVRAGVVALTKCDLADREWIDLVRDEVEELLRATPLRDAPVVETSVRDGRGIEELKRVIGEQLGRAAVRGVDDLFRLPVDRAFSVKGTGTVVTGTAWSGRVTVATEARLFPANRVVRVRAIQVHGQPCDMATAGARVAVALAGVEVADIPRGSVLVSEGAWVPTTRFLGEVTLEAGVADLRPREWVQLHVGTAEVQARVVTSATRVPGAAVAARVVTDAPLVLRAGDRFVLRRSQPLETIGGGRVVDPAPSHRRSKPTALWDEDPRRRLRSLVELSGSSGFDLTFAPIRAGVETSRVTSATTGLAGVTKIGDRIYLDSVLGEIEEQIEREVLGYHDLNPLSAGMPASRLRSALGVAESLVDACVERLRLGGRLEVGEGGVRRPGWLPRMSDDATATRDWLLQRIAGAGLEPPSVAELRAERDGAELLPLLRILEREGKLVAVEADRFFAREELVAGVGRLQAAMHGGDVYSPSQLREVLGVSRKYLMPLLEFCDRRRITERRTEGRVLAGGQVG